MAQQGASSELFAAAAAEELQVAMDQAVARMSIVYANGFTTLIDEISEEVWASWDASGELAVVCAHEGFEDDELICEDQSDGQGIIISGQVSVAA
jgi:hypothetical protein